MQWHYSHPMNRWIAIAATVAVVACHHAESPDSHATTELAPPPYAIEIARP